MILFVLDCNLFSSILLNFSIKQTFLEGKTVFFYFRNTTNTIKSIYSFFVWAGGKRYLSSKIRLQSQIISFSKVFFFQCCEYAASFHILLRKRKVSEKILFSFPCHISLEVLLIFIAIIRNDLLHGKSFREVFFFESWQIRNQFDCKAHTVYRLYITEIWTA